MKLREAMLCIDCEEVFALNGSDQCPVCTSHAIFALSRWLLEEKYGSADWKPPASPPS